MQPCNTRRAPLTVSSCTGSVRQAFSNDGAWLVKSTGCPPTTLQRSALSPPSHPRCHPAAAAALPDAAPAALPRGAASADGQPGHASELVKLATREPKQLAEQAQQALAQKAWLRPVPFPQKPPPLSTIGADAGQQQQLSAMAPWASPPADAQVRKPKAWHPRPCTLDPEPYPCRGRGAGLLHGRPGCIKPARFEGTKGQTGLHQQRQLSAMPPWPPRLLMLRCAEDNIQQPKRLLCGNE